MKIQVSFRRTVTYSSEVTCTAEKWKKWNAQLDAAKGHKRREAEALLFEEFFDASEEGDYDDPELDDFFSLEDEPEDESESEPEGAK